MQWQHVTGVIFVLSHYITLSRRQFKLSHPFKWIASNYYCLNYWKCWERQSLKCSNQVTKVLITLKRFWHSHLRCREPSTFCDPNRPLFNCSIQWSRVPERWQVPTQFSFQFCLKAANLWAERRLDWSTPVFLVYHLRNSSLCTHSVQVRCIACCCDHNVGHPWACLLHGRLYFFWAFCAADMFYFNSHSQRVAGKKPSPVSFAIILWTTV